LVGLSIVRARIGNSMRNFSGRTFILFCLIDFLPQPGWNPRGWLFLDFLGSFFSLLPADGVSRAHYAGFALRCPPVPPPLNRRCLLTIPLDCRCAERLATFSCLSGGRYPFISHGVLRSLLSLLFCFRRYSPPPFTMFPPLSSYPS